MPDELLKPYLEAKSEREAERRLNQLSESFLRPLVSSVVHSLLYKDQADAIQEALLAINHQIQQIRQSQKLSGVETAKPIRALRSYAVTVARRAAFKQQAAQQEAAKSISLEALLEDQGQEPEADNADPFAQAVSHETLKIIWREIKALSPYQCAVLLLDWKQIPGGPVSLFSGAGVASLEEIASVLRLDVTMLAGPLCWEDEQIATVLKSKKENVRSLRSKTCQRLQRRLEAEQIGDVFAARTSIDDGGQLHAR